MTKYQEDINEAQALISEFGMAFVIRRKADSDLVMTFSESDFGTLSLSGNTLTVDSGDLSSVISEGDKISLREVDNFENRGPFEVSSVSTLSLAINGSFSASEEAEWFLDVQSNADVDTVDYGVPLPPQSITRQTFDYAFRDGSLQISRAKDFILSARDLDFRPEPGDLIQMGTSSWIEGNEAWTIFGVTPLEPDGTPIIWSGIMTKG